MDSPFGVPPIDTAAIAGAAQTDKLRMMSLSPNKKMSDRKMRETADEFEAMVYRAMIKEMRKTVPTEDGLFGESQQMQMYTDIMDDNMAQHLAKENNLGIDQLIYEELKEKSKNIVNARDAKKEKDFLDLPGAQPGEAEDFIPLHTSTEKFLDLNQSPRMMELRKKEEKFQPLSDHPRIGTDRIQQ